MKTKHTFALLIVAIFLFAMLFYGDKMTFGEIVGAFAANSLLISTLWQWFSKEEIKMKNRYLEKKVQDGTTRIKYLQEHNETLFKAAYGDKKTKASDERI